MAVGDLVLYYNYGTYGFQIIKETPCYVTMRNLKQISDNWTYYPEKGHPEMGGTWYHHFEKDNFADEDENTIDNVIRVKKTKVTPYHGEILEYHRHDE